MFYYNGYVGPDTRVIFHPHIPRTGGRFLENLFKASDLYPSHNDYSTKKENVSIPHLDRELYEDYYDEEALSLPSFTVVRNPITRFISAYRVTRDIHSLPDINTFVKELPEFYKKNPRSCDNFFTPQYKFVKRGMKIWKFERGFGEDFCNWINKEFDMIFDKLLKYRSRSVLNKYHLDYKEKLYYENNCTVNDKLTKRSILRLIRFYWRDYLIV